ncbi:MAG: hypothetical protein KDB04_07730 [Acidimicrobiales bacterium]|nr:hypothetical protein [Acidimicrobiales bacterium]HRW37561.1 hypothetical protein [Aquihabitans sp.]
MFKSGSKFLFGLAAIGFVAAIAYAVATSDQGPIDSVLGPLTLGYKGGVGDHVGYSILVSLSFLSLFLGIFLSSLRDADPEAEAQLVGLETVPEAPAPTTANYWPVIGAFSAAALVIGLAVGPVMFVIGAIGLTITIVEWAARAWADRATGDPAVNDAIRNRFMYPVEIPGLAVLGIAGIVLAVSRILLALPKIGSYLVFGIVPAIFLAVGYLVIAKPKLSQNAIAAMLLVGGIAILGGGVAAAIAGEREHGGDHEEEHSGEEGLAPLPGPAELVITVGN